MKYYYKQISKKDGIILRGVVNTPDDFDTDKKYPTVIMYHGFGGNRDGRTWMRIQNAKQLTSKGYVVVRFDFSGTNESDGEFYDMTVNREKEEAIMIYNFTKTRAYVDNDRIYLIGHSLGGVIATLIASEVNPKAVALLAPASDMNNVDFLEVMKASVFDIDKEKSTSSLIKLIKENKDMDIGGEKISVKFWLEFLPINIYAKASKYEGNVLILRGTKDELVFNDANIKLKEAYPNASYEQIEGADHSFTNYDHRQIIFEKMYEFFENN